MATKTRLCVRPLLVNHPSDSPGHNCEIYVTTVWEYVGLLLTFNNYQSELTYLFFIAAISFVIIATLFLRYRAQLKEELLKLSFRERVAMIGVYLTGFSVFFFFLSSGVSLVGIPLALGGLGILIWVYARRKKPRATVQHAP